MALDRRQLLTRGAGLATAPLVLSSASAAASSLSAAGGESGGRGAGTPYVRNRAPLAPAAYLRLPPGSVRAHGWLATQLDRQLHGLNGRMTEVSHFLRYDDTGWIHPDRSGWEEVPYWLRGYASLGAATGDDTVQRETARWAEGVLATQADDGFFGPSELRTSLDGGPDVWPHMPMTHALRTYAEHTGDDRVEPFLLRYFRFLAGQPDSVYSKGWGTYRWADTLDVLAWLYNRTGEGFLLDVAAAAHRHSADYVHGLPSPHNVNITQGFREPAHYAVFSGDSALRKATYERYAQVMRTWGRFPGGGFAGDENVRDGYGDPRQGFETCGIVEFMQSHEILTRITGDPVWADRTEELAFNSLPAALDPRGLGVHYITSANSIRLDREAKTRGQFQNDFPMLAYKPGIDSAPEGYRCCPHNYGIGWPYFTEEMWLATPDGGLAAALHGPARVTARVRGGAKVTVTTDTRYPFADTLDFTVDPADGPVRFPLRLRIPGWCRKPLITVDGRRTHPDPGPGWAEVERTWHSGDTVRLRLPMPTRVHTWTENRDARSVERGPLTYSLLIEEQWQRYAGTDEWPEYEVFARSPWNYGLSGSGEGASEFRVREPRAGDPDDPFTPDTAPVRLTTRGRRLPQWTADEEDVVGLLPQSPASSQQPEERLTLIPMGSARLRITAFPQTG